MSLIKPLVFGGIDGLTTTLALVWGSTAAGEHVVSSAAVVVLGLANLLATGMSMGIGDYAGTLAEHDEKARQSEKARGDQSPLMPSVALRKDVQLAAIRSGLTMFLSFIVFGGIPLLAYIPSATADQGTRRTISTVLCILSFFGLGTVRARLTEGSIIKASLQMVFMGTGAALVSFMSAKAIYWGLVGVESPSQSG